MEIAPKAHVGHKPSVATDRYLAGENVVFRSMVNAMTDHQWKTFFEICANVLGPGGRHRATSSTSWCAWTVFDRLSSDLHYWTSGLPAPQDIGDSYIKDSGVWGQPFLYSSLAHVVIPRQFDWESGDFKNDTHASGTRQQNLDQLSNELSSAGIPHRLTDLVLEIKLY